jgi:hypothetical protein
MEESKMKEGIYVTISNNLSATNKEYGTNSFMTDMIGKTYKIEKVRGSSREGYYAVIKGCMWHPKDLSEQSVEKKPEPFHFNIEELNI